jgi:hypothetical protein
MKRFVLLAFALLLVLPLDAQQIFNEVKYKRFNFGAKVGMNASFPVINTLKVNGTKIDDITMQYRVGYLFSVFGRINMHRFFIEPGASWNKREGNMNFTIPASVFSTNHNRNGHGDYDYYGHRSFRRCPHEHTFPGFSNHVRI